jgi:hypothetical protein
MVILAVLETGRSRFLLFFPNCNLEVAINLNPGIATLNGLKTGMKRRHSFLVEKREKTSSFFV